MGALPLDPVIPSILGSSNDGGWDGDRSLWKKIAVDGCGLDVDVDGAWAEVVVASAGKVT